MENVGDYGAQRVAADEQAIGNPLAGSNPALSMLPPGPGVKRRSRDAARSEPLEN